MNGIFMTQSQYDVLAIGNALVDILCSADDKLLAKHEIQKGSMTLISDEKAKNIYADMGQTRQVSGGSAANTVAAIANLGGKSAFIGSIADDEVGNTFKHDIQASSVDFFGFTHQDEESGTGRCNILVSDDAERTMATFLGCAGNIPDTALNDSVLKNSAITYVEGYLWDQEVTKNTIKSALEIVSNAGKQSAFTLSDVFCVERHREEFLDLIENKFDIIFSNEDEIKSLFQTETFDAALQKTREFNKLFVITRGANGSVVVHKDRVHIIDSVKPTQLIDTTGAGDSFAAGFLYGLTQNMSYYDSAVIGSIAASEMISHFGARAVSNLAELVQDVKKAA